MPEQKSRHKLLVADTGTRSTKHLPRVCWLTIIYAAPLATVEKPRDGNSMRRQDKLTNNFETLDGRPRPISPLACGRRFTSSAVCDAQASGSGDLRMEALPISALAAIITPADLPLFCNPRKDDTGRRWHQQINAEIGGDFRRQIGNGRHACVGNMKKRWRASPGDLKATHTAYFVPRG